METLARTLFLTSISAFFVFAVSDMLRPGFVSNYFSVHWVLLVAVASGLWWSLVGHGGRDRRGVFTVVSLSAGAALSASAWRMSEGLGEYVLLVVCVAFFTPLLILQLLRSST